jgi:hypothetical protein
MFQDVRATVSWSLALHTISVVHPIKSGVGGSGSGIFLTDVAASIFGLDIQGTEELLLSSPVGLDSCNCISSILSYHTTSIIF